jgi:peptide/nickel transport system ATP-binding protein
MSDSESIIRISDLHIEAKTQAGWTEVVRGVDLSLRRGEVLGIIGESGAGKSTLALAAMGFVRDGTRVSSGSVTFDGIDLVNCSERRLQNLRGSRIAYVAQSAAASFNPAHRLIDQFSEAPVTKKLLTRAEAENQAKKLYRSLLMPDPDSIGFRYPHQVSGGQLQRAMMAMAMACRPDVIIFDEPTTALDVTTQVEVLATIKVIVEQFRTAALYISHDLSVVAQMADRVMVLRYGKLVEEGETRKILNSASDPYTQQLLSVRRRPKDASNLDTRNEAILSVRDVSASYGRNQVLSNVGFDVSSHRTTAVVGESGSGKSTLARVISGLLAPDSGSITFLGSQLAEVLRHRSQLDTQRIQLVHQSPDAALNPRQTVGEILGRPLTLYHRLERAAREKRIAELLRLVELPPSFSTRYPGQLSGGEKQRICIARALAAEPTLIVCDEVTSALDHLVAEGVLNLLQALQTRMGLSYIFITHDIDTVRAIADEIIVMKDGKIVTQGPRDAVLSPPHDPYTSELLSSVPQMDPDWLTTLLAQRRSQSEQRASNA